MHWRIASGLQSGARQSAGRETVKTPLIFATAVARAVLAIVLTLGASSMSVAATFVYVSDAEDGTIDSYVMDTKTGALTSIGSVATPGHATSVAVAPSAAFAFVANCLDTPGSCYNRTSTLPGSVATYAIDPTSGSLTFIGTIATGAYPAAIAIDPSGNFAYVTNFNSDSVSMYSIDGTGGLTLIGTVGS